MIFGRGNHKSITMKKLFLLFLTIGVFTSCSKENNGDDPNNPSKCRLESMHDDEGGKITFTYNSDGKVHKVVGLEEEENFPTSFVYKQSSIEVTVGDHSKPSGNNKLFSYVLDQNNRVIERKVNYNNEGFRTHSRFIYNNAGYLVGITGASGEKYVTISYTGGNIQEVYHHNFYESTNLEYDHDKAYVPYTNLIIMLFSDNSEDADYFLYEQGYFGNRINNRIIKENYKSRNNQSITTFTYNEDKNGNVSSLNAKRNDYAPYTAYFNFKCK